MISLPGTENTSIFPQDIIGNENILFMGNEDDDPDFVDIEIEEEEKKSSKNFYENLAEKLPDQVLTDISNQIIEGIDNDKESRKMWDQNFIKALSYLGIKPEESRKVPFMQACSAIDSTLAEANLRFFSTARAELFPSQGPTNYKVKGKDNEEKDRRGQRIKEWMNYYLTLEDRDYYPDSDRLLMYLGLVGCAFRKVYQDPLTNKPISRFIDPQDFLINNNCVSILSSERITHVLYLSRKEIMLRQKADFYMDILLPKKSGEDLDESDITKKIRSVEGIDLHSYEDRSLFTIYETHTELDIEEDEFHKDKDLPLPYIVTIEASTKKVLSIRRNWEEDDNTFKRKEFFVQYNYLPGFGIYGIGLMNLIGSNCMVLTSILRMLIDAGTLKNFPGGLRVKGSRLENNDKAYGPCEFVEVETGGMPLRDSIMLNPYDEPSRALMELRMQLIQQTQNLSNTAETKLSEYQSDAPVGTTLALLEVQGRLQSSIMRGLHSSLNNELDLLYNLFSQTLPDDPYEFSVAGDDIEIMRSDFKEDISIIPISDPNLATSTQKMIKAEGILRLANGAPQLHDMREVYHEVYESMGIKDIDKILPPEKEAIPLDPITENMNAMEGKPLKAAMWQDHPAHNINHDVVINDPNTPPDVRSNLIAHRRTHDAMEYLKQMQQKMGQELPPLEEIINPEV